MMSNDVDPKNVLSKSAIESILQNIDEVAYQGVKKATANAVIRFVPMGMMEVPKHIEKKVRQRRINVIDVRKNIKYIHAPFSKDLSVRLSINEMIGTLFVLTKHEGQHEHTLNLLTNFLSKYNLTPIQTSLERETHILSYQVSNYIQEHGEN